MRAILQELTYDSLLDGAVWPFDDHYLRPPHFHGQLECLIVLRGTARLHLGTATETVGQGQLCWILPGVPHVMSHFSDDFDMWVVQFDPGLVGSCWHVHQADAAVASADAALFHRWPVVLGDRLAGRAAVDVGAAAIERLDDLAARVWGARSALEARPCLRVLCDLALRVTWPNVDQRRESSVSQLGSCLLLASPLMDRAALAAALGISQGFLSRSFHREMGVTFLEHRARTRVAHFLALAQNNGADGRGGRHNLLDAALDAGFGSYSQFHRTFTRVSGSGPRDYLQGGRHRLQLLVTSERAQPHAGTTQALPDRQRQRAPADGAPAPR